MPNSLTIEGYASATQALHSIHCAVVLGACSVSIYRTDTASLQKEQAKLIPLFPKQRAECIKNRKEKAGSEGSMGSGK